MAACAHELALKQESSDCMTNQVFQTSDKNTQVYDFPKCAKPVPSINEIISNMKYLKIGKNKISITLTKAFDNNKNGCS